MHKIKDKIAPPGSDDPEFVEKVDQLEQLHDQYTRLVKPMAQYTRNISHLSASFTAVATAVHKRFTAGRPIKRMTSFVTGSG
jgi:hypothetical protein